VKQAAKEYTFKIVGWVLLVIGVLAIPLPGPGALIILLAVLVLAQQYEWAERRLESVKRWAFKSAADGVQTWPRIIASAFGVVWLIGVGVFWIVSPPEPSWWPSQLPAWTWLPGGAVAGGTLIFSGVVALGILVYSFVKFRGADHPEAKAERTVASDTTPPA
jgi:uncharacterized protein (TIGR02611 family)